MERIRGHDRTAGLCLLSAQPLRRRRRLLLRRQRMGEAARRAVLSDRSGSRGPRNGEADLRPRRLRLGQRSKTRLAGRNLLDPGLVEHRSEHRVEHASGGARGAAVPDHRNHELPRLGVADVPLDQPQPAAPGSPVLRPSRPRRHDRAGGLVLQPGGAHRCERFCSARQRAIGNTWRRPSASPLPPRPTTTSKRESQPSRSPSTRSISRT